MAENSAFHSGPLRRLCGLGRSFSASPRTQPRTTHLRAACAAVTFSSARTHAVWRRTPPPAPTANPSSARCAPAAAGKTTAAGNSFLALLFFYYNKSPQFSQACFCRTRPGKARPRSISFDLSILVILSRWSTKKAEMAARSCTGSPRARPGTSATRAGAIKYLGISYVLTAQVRIRHHSGCLNRFQATMVGGKLFEKSFPPRPPSETFRLLQQPCRPPARL